MFITVTTLFGGNERLVGVDHIVLVMADARSDRAILRIPDKDGGHLDLRVRESFDQIRSMIASGDLLLR